MPLFPHRAPMLETIALVLVLAGASVPDDLPWRPSPWFAEKCLTQSIAPDARIHVNSPVDAHSAPARATRLIVYALPNGNTIEQTLGCRMAEGLDWHYDIQHVAAQVRLLREAVPDERIVLVCAEAGGLSWPNWRRTHADANANIARMLDDWRRRFAAPDCKVLLAGHSGGGSFLFGLIEAGDAIPEYIDRIAFLDANYSFDAALHAAKLERWLDGGDSRRLMVLAYDDREITYEGKKVVGPTGGTFRATQRMRDAFAKPFGLVETVKPPFHETLGLAGRVHFYVHPNPENKILHTALVGEMNGLVHVATLGTPLEETWGTFGGPRAYTKWVQPTAETASGEPAAANTVPSVSAADPPPSAKLPARPADAVGGRQFIKSLEGMELDERETAIRREITGGNFPNFLREFVAVTLRGAPTVDARDGEATAQIEVMPDYLAVGSDADFVRMPMTPQTAQRIADAFGCVLPTRKIVDAIDAQAAVHLAPHPLSREREVVATFLEHHRIVEKQRAGKPLGLLVTGIKKDIVLSPRIFERPRRLAIYGWRQLNGEPIQPLTIVHWNRYVDYSHGVRLVRDRVQIGPRRQKITALLADPNRCPLVSDEGPMNPPNYPLAE
jgi:hypothetical protein